MRARVAHAYNRRARYRHSGDYEDYWIGRYSFTERSQLAGIHGFFGQRGEKSLASPVILHYRNGHAV
jgi:hypothetical protein